MNAAKKVIVTAIHEILRPEGFEKDGGIWFREQDGVLSMLALEQSRYGFPTFSIEVGLHVRGFGYPDAGFSKRGVPAASLGGWHLIGPLGQGNKELNEALDGRSGVSDEFRRAVVQDVLRSQALPMFADFRTKDCVHRRSEDSGLLTTIALRKWLDA